MSCPGKGEQPIAPSVVVVCQEAAARERGRMLASRLGVPLLETNEAGWREIAEGSFALLVDTGRIALGAPGTPRTEPVAVDFEDSRLLRRVSEPRARQQDLARAVGASERRALRGVDATAGWGTDSAVLAALGCRVCMIERDPVVAVLLEDGLRRARRSVKAAVRELAGRLEMRCGDARQLLDAWQGAAPDVVLIDPMFPERTKTAAVRKEMRFFQQLVGFDEDAPALLRAALERAVFRVVVKRPRRAPPLAGPKPSHEIAGRSTRFDVYALRSLSPRRQASSGC